MKKIIFLVLSVVVLGGCATGRPINPQIAKDQNICRHSIGHTSTLNQKGILISACMTDLRNKRFQAEQNKLEREHELNRGKSVKKDSSNCTHKKVGNSVHTNCR